MKGKLSAIIAGTMLAVTGTTLPASAIVSSTVGQQQIGVQQETLLLAANKGNSVKGGHSTGKSPSNKEKHQKGEARRNQDQNVNPAFKNYKKHGGKLSKDTWQKAGQPKK
jgi:hypothetical protein